ncbi:MAG: tetratricopeptide repeat protein [Pirellulaceae bacterium]|nr:tetratricopeptide repeat protein [Pirellulaceae bacterium]
MPIPNPLVNRFPTGRAAPKRVATATALIFVASVLSGCGSSQSPTSKNPTEIETVEQSTSQQPGDASTARQSDVTTEPKPEPATVVPPVASDRDTKIARADQLAGQGKFSEAGDIYQSVLLSAPDDVEALFRLANVYAAIGNLEQAIEIIEEIPEDHPQAGLPALGQSADWYARLGNYDQSQKNFEKVLRLAPQAYVARRQLAFQLNRQGRRHEAAEHLRQLCRQGNILQDELHALISLSDPMFDDPSEPQPEGGGRRYTPIGAMGQARMLFGEHQYQQAADKVRSLVESGDAPPAVVAFYGRAVAEAQDDDQFRWWLSKTNDATKQFAEYWSAIGAFLMIDGKTKPAIRAFLEAVDRDPTDLASMSRLQSLFESTGQSAVAETWGERWRAVRDTVRANNRVADSQPPNVDEIANLANLLFELDRKLEAVMWKSIESLHRGLPKQQIAGLNEQRKHLIASNSGFPSQSRRLCDVEIDTYPLPQLETSGAVASAPIRSSEKIDPPLIAATFHNVASDISLTHVFQVGSRPKSEGFTIYQTLGGAVAALDYDLDGHVDLSLGQGSGEPPSYVGKLSNVLYRQVDDRLQEQTEAAGVSEYRYSSGMTVGDWNQDGFPDLVCANIGPNQLFINNGDGTFTSETLDDRNDLTLLPASLAVADLTGDALPDLFESNYIHDPDLARLPQRNAQGDVIQTLGPLTYQAGKDRLGINDGTGNVRFRPITSDKEVASPALGVVVTDFDPASGNEIFVGNDLKPNQLWVRDAGADAWNDAAILQGCAFGFSGAATASMGIAAGDFDRNGKIDLHITNFQDQTVSLFLGRQTGFQDRNVQWGLSTHSASVLGFGTQAIDYDNDSLLDLVVTNGHIENATVLAAPFQQPAQLFANRGNRFEWLNVDDRSGYWDAPHLGRGLARLDFNRDGNNDFVITHLGETTALMINATQTDNHWIQLQFIGVVSERDSIGTKITIRFDDQTRSEWITAGDGYFCNNESLIPFGLGPSKSIDEIQVDWPSGKQQTFTDVAVDQRLLILEHEDEPFTLPIGR